MIKNRRAFIVGLKSSKLSNKCRLSGRVCRIISNKFLF